MITTIPDIEKKLGLPENSIPYKKKRKGRPRFRNGIDMAPYRAALVKRIKDAHPHIYLKEIADIIGLNDHTSAFRLLNLADKLRKDDEFINAYNSIGDCIFIVDDEREKLLNLLSTISPMINVDEFIKDKLSEQFTIVNKVYRLTQHRLHTLLIEFLQANQSATNNENKNPNGSIPEQGTGRSPGEDEPPTPT